MDRIAGRFGRVEPRRRARQLVLGLLSDLPRKNCWTIAEHVGDRSPDGLQHLLAEACWDHDGVRDDLRDYVVAGLGDQNAVLVVDLCRPRNYADIGSGGDGNGAGEVGFSPAPNRRRVGIVPWPDGRCGCRGRVLRERRQVMTGRRRKPGRMGPFIEGYRDWLAGRGYTSATVINMLAMAGGLGRWMDTHDLAVAELDRAVIAQFRNAMRTAGMRCVPGARGLDPLLDYLRHVGVLVASPAPATPVEALVER